MSKIARLLLLTWGTILLACYAAIPATAQTLFQQTPCGVAFSGIQLPGTKGLTPVNGGTIVYDSNQGLCWLGDANLAGHPEVHAVIPLAATNPDGSIPVINPDGTMDYWTAVNWVNGLNSFNNGKGWLNHNNWQLPTNPHRDPTCSSVNTDDFGVQCTGGALSNLYYVGLARSYPNSVVPYFLDFIGPFFNLQPGLYWTADTNSGGELTFSFNTGIKGANTTKYNFFHVLPMTTTVLGPVPVGTGVLPYLSGPAAGRAVYDTMTGISWTLNANLPAFKNFGDTDTVTLTADVNKNTLTVPVINKDGAVHFSAIDPANTTSGWIVSMNASGYAGTNTWQLPGVEDLRHLYNHLSISAGDTRLEWPFFVGPFWRLQPGFYWACVRADGTGSEGPCDLTQNAPSPPPPATPLQESFNFDDGFEGTDLQDKQFYVTAYFPAR